MTSQRISIDPNAPFAPPNGRKSFLSADLDIFRSQLPLQSLPAALQVGETDRLIPPLMHLGWIVGSAHLLKMIASNPRYYRHRRFLTDPDGSNPCYNEMNTLFNSHIMRAMLEDIGLPQLSTLLVRIMPVATQNHPDEWAVVVGHSRRDGITPEGTIPEAYHARIGAFFGREEQSMWYLDILEWCWEINLGYGWKRKQAEMKQKKKAKRTHSQSPQACLGPTKCPC